MPRKASSRKTPSAGKKAGARKSSAKTTTTASEARAAARESSGLAAPSAENELEVKARKNADPAHREASDETARRNASAQNLGPEARHPNLTSQPQKEAAAVVTPGAAQPERLNANGEGDAKEPVAAKPNLNKAVVKLGGVSKILREAGTPPKEDEIHVVQQGGGGAVVSSAGGALR